MSDEIKVYLDRLRGRDNIVDWGYCEDDAPLSYDRYNQWVEDNQYANLNYLTGTRAKMRERISAFYPQFQSALIFAFSYADVAKFLQQFYCSTDSNGLKIGSFVLGFAGKDYHHYLKERLEIIGKNIIQQQGGEFIIGLDVHPILERDLAVRSGLGWFGKNSMFISEQYGSFLILGSIFFNIKLNLSQRAITTDRCGSCQACITACPTDAISSNRTLDVAKCISNFTIEQFKDVAPPRGMENADGEIFGCDICQNVCPWNKKYLNSLSLKKYQWDERLVELLEKDSSFLLEKFSKMSNRQFRRLFKATSLERTGRIGVIKNIQFWHSLRSTVDSADDVK